MERTTLRRYLVSARHNLGDPSSSPSFDAAALTQVEMVRQHVQWVTLTGVPRKRGWPTQEQLLRLIRTRPGEAVGYQVAF